MADGDKLSIAALISVSLRRKIGRTIDVHWLVKNDEYAREIIRLSLAQNTDDLTGYAQKLQSLISTTNSSKSDVSTKSRNTSSESSFDSDEVNSKNIDAKKYIGHLR